jgi:hypothetical protein
MTTIIKSKIAASTPTTSRAPSSFFRPVLQHSAICILNSAFKSAPSCSSGFSLCPQCSLWLKKIRRNSAKTHNRFQLQRIELARLWPNTGQTLANSGRSMPTLAKPLPTLAALLPTLANSCQPPTSFPSFPSVQSRKTITFSAHAVRKRTTNSHSNNTPPSDPRWTPRWTPRRSPVDHPSITRRSPVPQRVRRVCETRP